MHIEIAQRLKPFSHKEGTFCVLPGSTLVFEIFPALIRFYDYEKEESVQRCEIEFALTGLVKDFTVQLDLERARIQVWGHYKEGYVSYRIAAHPKKGFSITLDRCPEDGVSFTHLDETAFPKKMYLYTEKGFVEMPHAYYKPVDHQRFSLGSHKKLDWDLVIRRLDLKDVLPVLFRLGFFIPDVVKPQGGTCEILDTLSLAIEQKDKSSVYEILTTFIKASFHGILTPRLKDTDFQGLHLTETVSGSPLFLLSEASLLIKKLFVSIKNNTLEILPVIPKEFHAGRMLHIPCGSFGTLHMEWSKKTIRRMNFHCLNDAEVNFKFSSEIKKFRLQKNQKEQMILDAKQKISFSQGSTYAFDNFQK